MTAKNFGVKRLDVLGSGDSTIESTEGALFLTSNTRVSVSTDFNVVGFTSLSGTTTISELNVVGFTSLSGITTTSDLYPPENNSGDIGTSTKVWNNVHANFLHGDATGITSMVAAGDGTYGSANTYPTITVSANGRISGIATKAITLSAAINANASVGDIGTYAFMQQSSGNTQYAPGDTLAGSSLRYSDATGRVHTTTPSGNWRCMGYDSGAALVNTGSGTGSSSYDASGIGTGTISGNVVGNTTVSTGKGAGGTVTTDNLNVEGTATINTITVNSVTVNTTVAYSATLWLRYS